MVVMVCAWVGVYEHVHEHNLLIELELIRTSDDPLIMDEGCHSYFII